MIQIQPPLSDRAKAAILAAFLTGVAAFLWLRYWEHLKQEQARLEWAQTFDRRQR